MVWNKFVLILVVLSFPLSCFARTITITFTHDVYDDTNEYIVKYRNKNGWQEVNCGKPQKNGTDIICVIENVDDLLCRTPISVSAILNDTSIYTSDIAIGKGICTEISDIGCSNVVIR